MTEGTTPEVLGKDTEPVVFLGDGLSIMRTIADNTSVEDVQKNGIVNFTHLEF